MALRKILSVLSYSKDSDSGVVLRTALVSGLNAVMDMGATYPLQVLGRQFQSGAPFHSNPRDYWRLMGVFLPPYGVGIAASDAANVIAQQRGYSELFSAMGVAGCVGAGVAAPSEAPVVYAHASGKMPIPGYKATVKSLGVKGLFRGATLVGGRDAITAAIFVKGPEILDSLGIDSQSDAGLLGLGAAGGLVSGVLDDLRTNYLVTKQNPFQNVAFFLGSCRKVNPTGLVIRSGIIAVSSWAYGSGAYKTVSEPIVDAGRNMMEKLRRSFS
jgi:hypothetical protein